MFRAIILVLLAVLLLPLIRSVIGLILKLFVDLFQPDSLKSMPGRPPPAEMGGELKKDPVCGTFISAATAIKKDVRGETYYFCSPECRDRFRS